MARSPAERLGLHTTFLLAEKGEIAAREAAVAGLVTEGREAELACRRLGDCYTSVVRIRCPICSAELDVPEDFGPRPFCSVRCKNIDLGNWLAERYTLAEPSTEAARADGSLEPSVAVQDHLP